MADRMNPAASPMKITFLLPEDNWTGGTRVVAMYMQELQRLGHTVLAVMPASTPPGWREQLRRWRRRLQAGGHRAHSARAGHIAELALPCQILAQARPITAADLPDADLVIATWWETAVWMQALPPSKGQHVHLIQGYEIWQGPHTIEAVHRALNLPNTKITISDALADTLRPVIQGQPLHVVSNGIDPDQFNAPDRERQQPPRVGFIYSTQSIKGSDLCIEAIRQARGLMPELRCLAMGTEAEHPAMPLPEGCEHFVHPQQQHIRDIYARCDAWLFASRLDSFGLPVLEAMACRTPVVAVPMGAAAQLVSADAGVMVKPEDPVALAQGLHHLLTLPPSQWQSISARAHAIAHRHTWKEAVHQLLAIIQSQASVQSRSNGQ